MLLVKKLTRWTIETPLYSDMTRLIGAIGGDDYSETLLKVVNAAVPVAHISFFRLPNGRQVDFHAIAGRADDHRWRDTAQKYLSRYVDLDPVRNLARHGVGRGGGMLIQFKASDLPNAAYRRDCYELLGIDERVTFFARDGHNLFQLNLYRDASLPAFSEDEVNAFTEVAAVALPTMAKHVEITADASLDAVRRPSVETLKHRLAALGHHLSDRETSVCAHAVLGRSIQATALELGLKPTSVVTYRGRAYQKLGIASHNELIGVVTY